MELHFNLCDVMNKLESVLSSNTNICYHRQECIINLHKLCCLFFTDTMLWAQCPIEYISQSRDIEAAVCCPHLKKAQILSKHVLGC